MNPIETTETDDLPKDEVKPSWLEVFLDLNLYCALCFVLGTGSCTGAEIGLVACGCVFSIADASYNLFHPTAPSIKYLLLGISLVSTILIAAFFLAPDII